ncbi:hypothetical protein B9Q06_12645 [Candidatus Marsarchaeota G2 archaeon ECH_B_2]|uniref:Uncharacterized protein n=3 Tax=Candidatus Marsarchaeota group 2 TaxID=2203771 RepID=A0A2R6B3F5_9ARCH|nr:MAG: hypothetical protein B9Q06_12645 [Candidatus Marsarchaeota G2 archaeon ECH_B_2]PSN97464.1 MAG: hypothetical protein B9Q07_12030 [Candidatus Marsarchaeota G2 archaeon ECH_B_3]PSN98761.1 MAG: hypothetical protein B9Q05_12480 [Candidatus Marsarchaeota G2 archaeon ECH_B_1]
MHALKQGRVVGFPVAGIQVQGFAGKVNDNKNASLTLPQGRGGGQRLRPLQGWAGRRSALFRRSQQFQNR